MGVLLGVLEHVASRVVPGWVAEAGSQDVRLLGICAAATALRAVATTASMAAARALAVLAQRRRIALRALDLTPEKVVGYKSPDRIEDTPGLLCTRIVERSEQIRRVLVAGPSEIELTMCAMGYSACTDDLLVLLRLVSERAPRSDPIRRHMMHAAARRAAQSLACTRKAFLAFARAGPPAAGG
jgi:hypothetical protein